ncbi:hypothetical protein MUP05_08290 [Candidatus Bathyarchaeota archaeon]|nr:hypothetical protein [Candidatus Bathyarchaeota archaeon]
MGRGLGKTVRMDRKLLSKVDRAIKELKDPFGIPFFCDRRAFLNVAVRNFLIAQMTVK